MKDHEYTCNGCEFYKHQTCVVDECPFEQALGVKRCDIDMIPSVCSVSPDCNVCNHYKDIESEDS